MSEEWIVGKNPVIEALRSGRTINKVIMLENIQHQSVKSIVQQCKQQGIVIQHVPKRKLDQIGPHHQGIAASIAAYDYIDFDDLLEIPAKKQEEPFFIILDELEDPHNLGSILRTADAVGAHGVIIPKRRSVQLTQTVAKASAGAIEYVPVARVTNIARTIDELKQQNIWVVGTDAAGKEDYRNLQGDMPLAIVIGSEGRGLSRLVREKCDWLIHLPMKGNVTSLNASVAASLLLYEEIGRAHV